MARHLPLHLPLRSTIVEDLREREDGVTDWRSEYPFQDRYASIDGQQYHYVDEGEGKQPIVCVHGNPTWSFYYRSLVSSLRSTQRVLAVDHIGCGLSDKPANYNYCLKQHTENLIQWMDQLDLRNIVLVVHDWGGAIGLGAAVARSDRVSKIVILNTAAFPPPYVPWRIAACRFPVLGSWSMLYLNSFAVAATFMAIDRLPKLSPNAKAGLLAPYDSPRHRVAIDRFVRDIPMNAQHPTRAVLEKLEQSLPSLASKPISMVWGMKDWCFRPECLERFSKVFPEAKIHKLEDVGHYVMEEAPDEVLQAIKNIL